MNDANQRVAENFRVDREEQPVSRLQRMRAVSSHRRPIEVLVIGATLVGASAAWLFARDHVEAYISTPLTALWGEFRRWLRFVPERAQLVFLILVAARSVFWIPALVRRPSVWTRRVNDRSAGSVTPSSVNRWRSVASISASSEARVSDGFGDSPLADAVHRLVNDYFEVTQGIRNGGDDRPARLSARERHLLEALPVEHLPAEHLPAEHLPAENPAEHLPAEVAMLLRRGLPSDSRRQLAEPSISVSPRRLKRLVARFGSTKRRHRPDGREAGASAMKAIGVAPIEFLGRYDAVANYLERQLDVRPRSQ